MTEGKKTAWHLTRLLMVSCWAAWILTFFLVVTLFQAILNVNVISQIVRRDSMKTQDLIESTPISILDRKKVDEALVRKYVDARYSFISDSVEMTRRWGPNGLVSFLSTPAVYAEFSPSEDKYESADENHRQQVVDILSAERKDNYYTVVFDIYETSGRGDWRKSTRSIVLQFAYMPERRFLGGMVSNPYGFVVTRVNESKITK